MHRNIRAWPEDPSQGRPIGGVVQSTLLLLGLGVLVALIASQWHLFTQMERRLDVPLISTARADYGANGPVASVAQVDLGIVQEMIRDSAPGAADLSARLSSAEALLRSSAVSESAVYSPAPPVSDSLHVPRPATLPQVSPLPTVLDDPHDQSLPEAPNPSGNVGTPSSQGPSGNSGPSGTLDPSNSPSTPVSAAAPVSSGTSGTTDKPGIPGSTATSTPSDKSGGSSSGGSGSGSGGSGSGGSGSGSGGSGSGSGSGGSGSGSSGSK